jgi:hypothetical protein
MDKKTCIITEGRMRRICDGGLFVLGVMTVTSEMLKAQSFDSKPRVARRNASDITPACAPRQEQQECLLVDS